MYKKDTWVEAEYYYESDIASTEFLVGTNYHKLSQTKWLSLESFAIYFVIYLFSS